MRAVWLVTMLTLPAAAACGGSSKKAASGPGGSGGDGKGSGSVIYEDQKGGYGAGDVTADDGGTPPQDVEPVVDQPPPGDGAGKRPEAPRPEPLKPPGNDLTPGQKAAKVEAALKKGMGNLKGGNLDGAINEAKIALDADETAVEAMLLLAHAYYLKGGYDDKAEAILEIARKNPEGANKAILWMLLGLIYDRTPDGVREDLALSAYEKACDLKDDYVAAWTNRGAIYLERKRFADAVRAYEKVVSIQAQTPRGHTNLGSAYRGRSADFPSDPAQRDAFLQKAETELKTAMTQQPGYAPAYFNLGLLYLDADPYPGLGEDAGKLKRLTLAMKYLNEHRLKAGPKADPRVDEYVAVAQKQYDKEQKKQDLKRKREAEKKKEAAEKPQ
jgi:hypothetical protein